MDLSSSSSSSTTPATAKEASNQKSLYGENSIESVNNDTVGSNSLYDSAMDNTTAYASFSESANNNSTLNTTATNSSTPTSTTTNDNYSEFNSSSASSGSMDFDTTLNGSEVLPLPADNVAVQIDFGPSYSLNKNDNHNAVDATMLFLQSEVTESYTSQEEVDPKSKLAHKTIFKTDNPDLSIIEINDNSIKEQDTANSVLVIESSSDDDFSKSADHPTKQIGAVNVAVTETDPTTPEISFNKHVSSQKNVCENLAEKRRRKAESLIYSSKQKLNIAIAEASAAETASSNSVADTGAVVNGNNISQPQTKREIHIYETLEEFEKNLPPTVTVLDTPFGSKVYLVGTAHFSEESQDDVSYVIRNVRPDVVMVELCPSRIPILKLDEKTLLEEAKSFNLSKLDDTFSENDCSLSSKKVKRSRLDGADALRQSANKSMELVTSFIQKRSAQEETKEDIFCKMLGTELKQLKLTETYDDVTTEMLLLVRRAKAAEQEILPWQVPREAPLYSDTCSSDPSPLQSSSLQSSVSSLDEFHDESLHNSTLVLETSAIEALDNVTFVEEGEDCIENLEGNNNSNGKRVQVQSVQILKQKDILQQALQSLFD